MRLLPRCAPGGSRSLWNCPPRRRGELHHDGLAALLPLPLLPKGRVVGGHLERVHGGAAEQGLDLGQRHVRPRRWRTFTSVCPSCQSSPSVSSRAPTTSATSGTPTQTRFRMATP